MRRVLVLLVSATFACAIAVHAQDSPSLGDIARQARQQKQQKDAHVAAKDASNDASNKDAANKETQAADAKSATPAPKVSRVITNEELPEHTAPSIATRRGSDSPAASDSPASGNRDEQGAQWRSRIQQQKQSIASLQQEIDSTSQSIHYAGGNCIANCVQWNERQKQKQDEVESMKGRLEEQKKQLDDMQESARKQGFGSSVYDPD